MNILKVITPDNLGKGITFNPETKKWEVQSGFDCAALSALPSKPWKKGTTLLAKQDGECIQLTALDSIFQEIGVGIAADKTSAFTGETYDVTVTVTNTGESKNELTNLTVQKPLLGNYEILDVRTSKQAVDEVETLDQLNYNLKGLAKGGTFILRFSVKANDVGTYQFSATVNPNSALDQNAKNNTDTIILKANTKIDTTYVPSVDCPRITATELDSNTVLQQLQPNHNKSTIGGIPRTLYDTTANSTSNIFSRRNTLKGLRVRLDNVSTVVGYKATQSYTDVMVIVNDDVATERWLVAGDYGSRIVGDHNFPKNGVDCYTFNNGILEITDDIKVFAFSCRTAGDNCRWQNYVLYAVRPITRKSIAVSNVTGATVKTQRLWGDMIIKGRLQGDHIGQMQVIPAADKANTEFYIGGQNHPVSADKIVVTVRAGTAASLNYTSTSEYAVTQVRGKTTITENTITVAADATSSDSVNSEFIQVIVED